MPTSWSDTAAAYARSFAPMCAGPIDKVLALTTGTTLLDVGCGTGELAHRAALAGRAVTAIDSDPDMVEMAGERVSGQEVSVVSGEFPAGVSLGYFDSVTANFVVNHVPNPRETVEALVDHTKPDGMIVATIWTNKKTALAEAFSAAVEDAGAKPVQGIRLPKEKDFERTVDGLAHLMMVAECRDVEGRLIEWTWRTTFEDIWAGISGGVAGMGATYLAQEPKVQDMMRETLQERLDEWRVGDGLQLPCVAALVGAKSP